MKTSIVLLVTLQLWNTCRGAQKIWYMDDVKDCSHIEPIAVYRNETVRVNARSTMDQISRQGGCSLSFTAVDTVQKEDAKLQVDIVAIRIQDCSVSLHLESGNPLSGTGKGRQVLKTFSCGVQDKQPLFTNGRDLFISLYKTNSLTSEYDYQLRISQYNLTPIRTPDPPPNYLLIGVTIFGALICLGLLGIGVYLTVANYRSRNKDWGTSYSYSWVCCRGHRERYRDRVGDAAASDINGDAVIPLNTPRNPD